MKVELKEMMVAAAFGPLGFGCSEKEFLFHFSEPDDVFEYDKEMGGKIFLYGSYEFSFWKNAFFYFQNDSVNAGIIDFDNMFVNRSSLTIDPWFLTPNTYFSLENVLTILNAEKIAFNISDYKVNQKLQPGTSIVTLENGAYMDFVYSTSILNLERKEKHTSSKEEILENEEDFVLNGFRFQDPDW